MMERKRIPSEKNEAALSRDLALVRDVLAGSLEAWHELIDRYSGLIFAVIRRRLVMEDEDTWRSVYVDILKSLYDGKLSLYRGDARLSTWLTVFTRSRALDVYRRRHGRHAPPRGYDKLEEFDREVFRLFYIDVLPLEVIAHVLQCKGFSAEADTIIESLQRIGDILDGRLLERLDSQRQSRRWGVDSVRMLTYLARLELDYEERSAGGRPDSHLMEKEASEIAGRVRRSVSRLPPVERQIIFYRFDRGWSAKQISDELGLGGQRRVYTLIDKIVRKLRESVMPEEE